MIMKHGRKALDRGRKSVCEMTSRAKVRMSERGHAVCNLERGVKIAVGDSDGRIAKGTKEQRMERMVVGG